MASKSSLISLFTLSLLLLTHFSLLYYAIAEETRNKTSSSFEFLEHLKGRHEGEVKSINNLENNHENFGYLELNYKNHNHSNDDDFDDFLEDDIKTLTSSGYYGAALIWLLYGLKGHDG
ncbi:hypothetical protein RchiOBHm_Chr2g0134151 [Rosa chinensis]|uniref:Uncharacterized protein n=1 Tax=Rosa chinensis TaxID=74649 RepID=A0A2P6RVR1_ROSCH|nr:hypothetical protein RchiOBHm_Chr2g0134151 [Rosa chinensis]